MLSFPVIVALHRCRPVFFIPLPLLNPILCMLFQVLYPVSPVFGTLTKTAGCVSTIPIPDTHHFAQAVSFHILPTSFAISWVLYLYSPRTQLVCFQPIPHSL